jgi:transposase-like protein
MFVTYPPHIREKAAALRHDGMTIDEIAERLAPISRTTIYYWVGQIEIPRTTKQTEGQRRATRRMQKQREQEREGAYRAGLCGFHAMVELDASFRDSSRCTSVRATSAVATRCPSRTPTP